MGYIYSLGQMNTTIGFIPFNLEQVKRPSELYRRYYGGAGVKAAEELFGTAFGFEAACRAGAIGISAMEPKGIRDYIFGKNEKIKSPSAEDMETDKFHTFLIWILAMLNNEELWTKSTKFAQALRDYALSSSGGKTDKSNKVKALLATYNKKNFIGVLTDIVSDAAASETMVEMASLINSMPNENVPFFITLVKFNYVSLCK